MTLVYVAIVINLMIIFFMPKRVTRAEIIFTWIFLVALNAQADILIAVMLDMFDYGVDGKVGFPEYVAEFFISPSFGIIFMNFMPHKWRKFFLYCLGWGAFSLLFEWATVKTHYMTYKNWSLWYSGICYLLIFLCIRWYLHYLRKYKHGAERSI